MTDARANVPAGKETATLAGGCFWCLEAVYDRMKGVESVESGYIGGKHPNPSYEAVCTGRTGHAEAVQITFDPNVVSYRELLEVFFVIHDPTTLNRQGHDVGTQYRSAVFYRTPAQKAAVERVIKDIGASRLWRDPVVTELAPLTEFYRGEEYHQDYFAKNPWAGYCRGVVAPKVAKFRKQFAAKLKK